MDSPSAISSTFGLLWGQILMFVPVPGLRFAWSSSVPCLPYYRSFSPCKLYHGQLHQNIIMSKSMIIIAFNQTFFTIRNSLQCDNFYLLVKVHRLAAGLLFHGLILPYPELEVNIFKLKICTKIAGGYFLKLCNLTNASQNGSGTFSHRN